MGAVNDEGRRALKSLGERIRLARTSIGLSQEALAERAGLHRTYVSSVERGERNPTLATLLKLGEALGVDLGDLLRGLK